MNLYQVAGPVKYNIAVLCMCIGSLLIAVTPTYATIGIAAPMILAIARIIEGLSSAANMARVPPI